MKEMTAEQQINYAKQSQAREIESNPNALYADAMREEKVRNVISQINPEILLTEIEHRIRGEKKDSVTLAWVPIDPNTPPISEKLVQNFISFLNIYLTQNVSLSNFSSQEINGIMEIIIAYVKNDLSDNAQLYGLTKKTEIEVPVIVEYLEPYTDEEGIVSMKATQVKVKQKTYIGDELTDYNTFTRIGHIVCQSSFSVLKQALNGTLRSSFFRALRVNETSNDGGNKSKLDMFKFW